MDKNKIKVSFEGYGEDIYEFFMNVFARDFIDSDEITNEDMENIDLKEVLNKIFNGKNND